MQLTATLTFITLLMVIIIFTAHHHYSGKLTKPRRKIKPHNDLASYFKNPKRQTQ